MNRPKTKGTQAETAFVSYLMGKGIYAERRALSGVSDRGDASVPAMRDIVFEVKNVRTPDYQGWLREAERERANASARVGVVVHKPHGVGIDNQGHWIVAMTLDQFLELTGLLEELS